MMNWTCAMAYGLRVIPWLMKVEEAVGGHKIRDSSSGGSHFGPSRSLESSSRASVAQSRNLMWVGILVSAEAKILDFPKFLVCRE
jgi:hypothetical protein